MSNRLIRYALYSFVALTAFGAGLWFSGSRQTEQAVPEASAVLLAMTLPDLQGKPQRLEQWRGKILVVNFWATWCAPCREEIPVFVKLQERYGAKNLQFVGISIDQVDKTAEFAASFKINYPLLIGTFDTVEVSRKVGNQKRALPYTVILNRKGDIVATELGGLTEEKLEAILKPLLL